MALKTDVENCIFITSSFTAEPVCTALAFWFERLEISAPIVFGNHNQVFQELHDSFSGLNRNTKGLNALLIRVEDYVNESNPNDRRWLTDFINAVNLAAKRGAGQLLLLSCPSSESFDRTIQLQCEQQLEAAWSDASNVQFVSSTEIDKLYASDTIHLPEGMDVGEIPYTDEYFVALGSIIARQARLIFTPPYKVVVLDCDNTLWAGVCGEVGADGIVIAQGHHEFHRELIRLQQSGVLLCLCSKNTEEDVRQVFLNRHDLLLDLSTHIVSHKINWHAKSQNILELAEDLNLGLDSFIFIDDNQLECAEVRSALPEVLTLLAPEDAAQYPEFLSHVWPFDLSTSTREDTLRTELYKRESRRKDMQRDSNGFQEFLERLELQVEIRPPLKTEYSRLAQLTQRTNQFNTAPAPISETELQQRLEADNNVLCVQVSDRFGDYGIVGGIFLSESGSNLSVDGLFLSCRVLGRGVEHRIICELAATRLVQIHFVPTARNEAARLFLDSLPGKPVAESSVNGAESGACVYSVKPGTVVSPVATETIDSREVSTTSLQDRASSTDTVRYILRNSTLARTPRELNSVAAILEQIRAEKRPRPAIAQNYVKPRSGLEQDIATIWQTILGLDTVGALDSFSELGGSSLQMAQVNAKLKVELGTDLSLAQQFSLPSVRQLADHLSLTDVSDGTNSASTINSATTQSAQTMDIAIVGTALRVPGAETPEQFWENISNGIESISQLSDEQLVAAGVDLRKVQSDPNYVRSKGTLSDIDCFDAAFFGVLPRDAESMDPQQRIFLELAHEVLERSGYDASRYKGKIGVFAGAYLDTYLIANICRDQQFLDEWIPNIQVGALGTELGNDKDYLATRVAYKLNLRGPSMTVQTACSTSLVAITQACQALVTSQADMVMAGGITITVPQEKGYSYQEGGILSPDGHCRAFDHRAAGTVFSNGGGVVLLKPLQNALDDGDTIHAVIRGFAINNDGGEKQSYTAPSIDGQSDVISMAHDMAGVDVTTINYVEAHGTGTSLGDPIEVAGLSKAFQQKTSATGFCNLGSVKPNIGHLDVASGVTAVNKICLSLQHGQIPPLINFEKANPAIDFAKTPFYVSTELENWNGVDGSPRRAGVSSFGVGGTNAHLVLEQAPESQFIPSERKQFFFPLSAKKPDALATIAERLHSWALENSSKPAEDVAFTLQLGREFHSHRAFVVADSLTGLSNKIADHAPASVHTQTASPPLVFMFPGQGAQKINMAREIYDTEREFRARIDEGAQILLEATGQDLREVVFPAEEIDPDLAADKLKRTEYAQPAIFLLEVALAEQWIRWGVRPDLMVGHSVGEFAAACVAGVFSFEDGLRTLSERGRLMGEMPGGSMLSVRCSETTIHPYLSEKVELAAVNGPELCVLAGPSDETAELASRLEADGIITRQLHTSHAFHSWMMEPIIDAFAECLAKLTLAPPQIPIFSTVTGQLLSDKDARDPYYWARHLRKPVLFLRALEHLWEQPDHVLLEVGPGNTLATVARQNPVRGSGQPIFNTSPHASSSESDTFALLTALGNLWTSGVEIDWQAFNATEKRQRLILPTYPFEKKRHWYTPKVQPVQLADQATAQATGLTATPMPVALTNAIPQVTAVNSPVHSQAGIQTAQQIAMDNKPDRLAQINAQIKNELSDLSGFSVEDLDDNASFLELGFDSLLLTQVGRALEKAFGVKISMRDLLDDCPSVVTMAKNLDSKADPSLFNEPATSDIAAPLTPAANVPNESQPSINTVQQPHIDPVDPVPHGYQQPMMPQPMPAQGYQQPMMPMQGQPPAPPMAPPPGSWPYPMPPGMPYPYGYPPAGMHPGGYHPGYPQPVAAPADHGTAEAITALTQQVGQLAAQVASLVSASSSQNQSGELASNPGEVAASQLKKKNLN